MDAKVSLEPETSSARVPVSLEAYLPRSRPERRSKTKRTSGLSGKSIQASSNDNSTSRQEESPRVAKFSEANDGISYLQEAGSYETVGRDKYPQTAFTDKYPQRAENDENLHTAGSHRDPQTENYNNYPQAEYNGQYLQTPGSNKYPRGEGRGRGRRTSGKRGRFNQAAGITESSQAVGRGRYPQTTGRNRTWRASGNGNKYQQATKNESSTVDSGRVQCPANLNSYESDQ